MQPCKGVRGAYIHDPNAGTDRICKYLASQEVAGACIGRQRRPRQVAQDIYCGLQQSPTCKAHYKMGKLVYLAFLGFLLVNFYERRALTLMSRLLSGPCGDHNMKSALGCYQRHRRGPQLLMMFSLHGLVSLSSQC